VLAAPDSRGHHLRIQQLGFTSYMLTYDRANADYTGSQTDLTCRPTLPTAQSLAASIIWSQLSPQPPCSSRLTTKTKADGRHRDAQLHHLKKVRPQSSERGSACVRRVGARGVACRARRDPLMSDDTVRLTSRCECYCYACIVSAAEAMRAHHQTSDAVGRAYDICRQAGDKPTLRMGY
jgi:hypothetical protein